MDEDRRIYVAVAVIALIAVGSLFVGRGGSRRGQAGTSFRSRLSAFGLAPDPGPSAPEPAAAAASASSPGAGLSAPEPMMTKAASRLFSNPSGATGGQPGAQEAPPAYASARAMNPSLVDSSPNFPGGSRSSSYSSAAPGAAAPAPGASASAGGGAGAGGTGGGTFGTGPRAAESAAGAKPGDARASGSAAASFGNAAGALAARGSGGGPGFPGGAAGKLSGDVKAAGGPPGGADGKAPELPSIAAPKPTGKDGGGGGSGGGGGGAAGGGKGMSGAAPKPDAAKGEPGATAGAGPSGSSLGSMSAGPGETAAPDEPAIQPVIGTPRVGTTTVNGGMFKLKPNGPAIIPTVVNVTPTGHSVVGFRAKLAIDADGDSEAYRSDKTGQSQTALLYKNGRSLDPTRIPFIVVPTDFGNTHPNVKLGDYATVSYGPKTIYAIVGDRGPAGVLGEASIAVARSLGINADPNRGGSNRPDFEYRIVAGSKDPQPAESAAQIQARGRAVFETAGAPVR